LEEERKGSLTGSEEVILRKKGKEAEATKQHEERRGPFHNKVVQVSNARNVKEEETGVIYNRKRKNKIELLGGKVQET